MKTQCLQTKWDAELFGWERKDRVALIRSLSYPRLKRVRYKRSKENWSK